MSSGIDCESAQGIFDDLHLVNFMERTESGEDRWHSIEKIEGLLMVVVVRTYRKAEPDQIIRIISARQATRHERKLYETAHR